MVEQRAGGGMNVVHTGVTVCADQRLADRAQVIAIMALRVLQIKIKQASHVELACSIASHVRHLDKQLSKGCIGIGCRTEPPSALRRQLAFNEDTASIQPGYECFAYGCSRSASDVNILYDLGGRVPCEPSQAIINRRANRF